MAAGRFREDLYFRLNMLRLEMPPLRARAGDPEILARFFFDQFARQGGRRVTGFSRAALEAIAGHASPGNVRELINRIRPAITMAEHQLIAPADLGLDGAAPKVHVAPLAATRRQPNGRRSAPRSRRPPAISPTPPCNCACRGLCCTG